MGEAFVLAISMPRPTRPDLPDIQQHVIQRGNDRQPCFFAEGADPRDYPWSSHRSNAFGEHDPLLSAHPAYLALAADTQQRERAYRSLTMETVEPEEIERIRLHVQRQHAYGTDRFRAAIEAQLGRTVEPQKIGRPREPNGQGDRLRLERSRLWPALMTRSA